MVKGVMVGVGWGRKVKVVGRSDGKLIGDRKDGVIEGQGHGGLRQTVRN